VATTLGEFPVDVAVVVVEEENVVVPLPEFEKVEWEFDSESKLSKRKE